MNGASGINSFFAKLGAVLMFWGAWMLNPVHADYSHVGNSVSADSPNTPIQERPPRELMWLSEQTLAHLRGFIKQLEPLPGQGPAVAVRNVYIDGATGLVHIDMSADFLDRASEILGFQWEDQLAIINSETDYFLRPWGNLRSVRFTFDGLPMEHYHPAEQVIWPPDETEDLNHDHPRDETQSSGNGDIVISAGHGRTLDFHGRGDPSWGWQRNEYFGVREDLVMPLYAETLRNLFISRSEATPEMARSRSDEIHEDSGEEWWKVAARYHLQNIFPDNPEIWNTNPGDMTRGRHVNQDIRSRPLFAEHIGASALISLHSNGSPNTALRGTKIYTNPSKPESAVLGNLALCYIREILHAQGGYEEFLVHERTFEGNHGEARLGPMPAILVEIAFHTNPLDAQAILDEEFRVAVMKGVEKGTRLYFQNDECIHFSITNIVDYPGTWGDYAYAEVFFEGFPQYPIEFMTEVLDCPPDIICIPSTAVIEEELPNPFAYAIYCDAESDHPPGVAQWRTTLTDADGVETNFDHEVACHPALHGPSGTGSFADNQILPPHAIPAMSANRQ